MHKDILLTGANGYVANSLYKKISRDRVLALDIDDSKDIDLRACISGLEPFRAQLQNIKYVIHLADPRLQFLNESNLPENLDRHKSFLDFLKTLESFKFIVFASSCSVYGFSDQMCTESSQAVPTTYYAQSKMSTEKLIKASGLNYKIFRFGTAYGLNSKTRYDLLVNDMAKQLADGKPYEIYEPRAMRPFVHVEDFSECLAWSIDNAAVNQVYNVASENFSKQDLADGFCFYESTFAEQLKLVDNKQELRNYMVDSSKLQDQKFIFSKLMKKEVNGLIEFHKKQT